MARAGLNRALSLIGGPDPVPLRPIERNGGLKRHFVRVDLMGKRYGVARYLFTKGPNGGSFSVGKFFC